MTMFAQKMDAQEAIDQAVAAFWKGNAAQCLELWERVRQQFPEQPQGYTQAGFQALELGEIALADSLAAQAMAKFPRMFAAYLLSAEAAMRSSAFHLALARWAIVRRNFPGQPQGYVRAGFAALELGNIPFAEAWAAQAEKKFPGAQDVRQLRAKIDETTKQLSAKAAKAALPDLLVIAEKALRLGLHRQAFSYFTLAMRHMPAQIRAFLGAVEAAMAQKNYRAAERICADVISRFPLNIEGYKQHVLCLEAQGKTERALAELESIKKKFPDAPYGWLKYAELQLKVGDYERADAEMKEAVRLFPKDTNTFLYFARLPALTQQAELQTTSLKRYVTVCHKFSSHYDVYIQALHHCYNIITTTNSMEAKKYYCRIFNTFLQHFTLKKHKNKYIPSILNHLLRYFHKTKSQDSSSEKQYIKKIAAYAPRIGNLKNILPVIKRLSPETIDIIIRDTGNYQKDIDQFKLNKYNIIYGKHNVTNYEYILIDTLWPAEIQEYKCKLIGYLHATDAAIGQFTLQNFSLLIYSSRKQMNTAGVLPCDPLPARHALPAHTNYKCEICYTGPYHLDEFLERRHEPKARIKEELAKELGIALPEDKPLVFMLEDEICHIGQMAYAANHMSRYATVLFKTFLPPAALTRFNDDIHIVRGYFAPNLLRFAADYICCGYMSGSFTTSVMLGQNVLPYYSRLVARRPQTLPPNLAWKPYDEFIPMPEPSLFSSKHILYSKFYKEGRLLDLADAAAFKNAILGPEYKEWYSSNLPNLQKEVFGDYLLEGAPQKTAEYIMRFVREGTLGKDCSAVYLKRNCFK